MPSAPAESPLPRHPPRACQACQACRDRYRRRARSRRQSRAREGFSSESRGVGSRQHAAGIRSKVLEDQAKGRVPELVPIRYGRMLVSPFTFYRGAAALMAMDLADTPQSGVKVQLCGDAHLSNFGAFPGARPPSGP